MNSSPPSQADLPLLDATSATTSATTELALQTSEARLSSVLESVVDGIIVIDHRGIIQSFNPAAERIFGYLDEEVRGRNVSMLMPKAYGDAHDGYLREHLATGRKRIIGVGREVSGLRNDGSIFPLDLAVSAMLVGDKHFFTGIVRDITERKRSELEMLRALEAAEAASRAKSEFLSSMSHELRTPLNAILGFGQLLAMDPKMRDEHADNAREIVNAGRHLLALINEVLNLAGIESGTLALNMEPVALHELIDECVLLAKPSAANQRLVIEADFAHCHPLWVRADRLYLKQAVMHLLSNAIKFNHEGGRVFIRCVCCSDERIQLRVVDTGMGIAADKLADLFTPFNRLGREAGAIEGSGIGLVISKRLIEMMGGEIGVTCQEGVGCEFWIELAQTQPSMHLNSVVQTSVVQASAAEP
jgi:PAS domain S-box-containing protein